LKLVTVKVELSTVGKDLVAVPLVRFGVGEDGNGDSVGVYGFGCGYDGKALQFVTARGRVVKADDRVLGRGGMSEITEKKNAVAVRAIELNLLRTARPTFRILGQSALPEPTARRGGKGKHPVQYPHRDREGSIVSQNQKFPTGPDRREGRGLN